MKPLPEPIRYFPVEKQWDKVLDSIRGSVRQCALSLTFFFPLKSLQLSFVSIEILALGLSLFRISSPTLYHS